MSTERIERRLSAILAVDVVGYTGLMRADEEGTLTLLKRLRREVIDPRIRANRGKIVKTMGDGLLRDGSANLNRGAEWSSRSRSARRLLRTEERP